MAKPNWAHPCAWPLFSSICRLGQGKLSSLQNWSAAQHPQPASQQTAQFPPAKGNQTRLWFEDFTDLGKVQLPGGGQLPHYLIGVPCHAPGHHVAKDAVKQVQRVFTWGRLRCSRSSSPCSESGPCHHPARPLRLCQEHQNVHNISTSKLSLTPKALAMVRLLSLMTGKPAWAEADH